jgi:hypothetical protein
LSSAVGLKENYYISISSMLYLMKKHVLLFFLLHLYISSHAQEWDFGFSIGSGSVYLIENADSGVDSNFGIPSLFSAYVKYTPEEAYFGLKLKYLNLNASLSGEDWQNLNQSLLPSRLDGFIENRTLLVQLERLRLSDAQFTAGYNFGVGLTSEVIAFDKQGQQSFDTAFSVVSIGGIFSYGLNEKLSLRLEPSLLWNDPLRSFNRSNYRMGGEDLHLVLEFGINYRFK